MNKGMRESLAVAAFASAAMVAAGAVRENLELGGTYEVECIGPDGQVKWRDKIKNLVTNVGKAFALDTVLSGSGYTAAWYLGLIGATSYTTGAAAGDTAASHGGWAEDTTYSNATRPAPSWNAASAGSKSSTATAFNINGTTIIKGCFLISVNTKGGTTGTLYSAGLFTGGDKALGNGDTLNVTYTGQA